MRKIFVSLLIYVPFIILIQASEIPDLKSLLESSKVSIDYEALDAGEIISTYREDLESTDTSIAMSMGLYLEAPYKEVLRELQSTNNKMTSYKKTIVIEIEDKKDLKKYFSDELYVKDEKNAVEQLLNYDGGDAFNFSKDEIKELKKVMKNSQNHTTSASLFMNDILFKRAEAYLDGGVDAIAAYEHADEDTTVSNDIKTSSLHFNLLKSNFPELYNDFLHYPKISSKKYQQRFYMLKDEIEGELTFTLKHQMIEEKNSFFIILERQFYISRGLDAIQTQILCMPYKEGTFVVLSSQSFTEKVSGFGRVFAVKVGRHMMYSNIKPIFDSLEKKFN